MIRDEPNNIMTANPQTEPTAAHLTFANGQEDCRGDLPTSHLLGLSSLGNDYASLRQCEYEDINVAVNQPAYLQLKDLPANFNFSEYSSQRHQNQHQHHDIRLQQQQQQQQQHPISQPALQHQQYTAQSADLYQYRGVNRGQQVTARGGQNYYGQLASAANTIVDRASIYLCNSDMWTRFHEHTTEMIITKQGRLEGAPV